MAVQTGLGASKIIILVAGGVGGSIVLRNSKISDLLSDLSRVLKKHLTEDGEGSSGGDGGDGTAPIVAQVRRLTMELRQLAASNRPMTIVNGSPSSGANLRSLVLPAAVIGVAGYGYMWLKGVSISKYMYVTKAHMASAVSTVSKQLQLVSSSLVATKRQLTSRLDFISRRLEDNTSVTEAIEAQVGVVGREVAQVGLEMREVSKHVKGLEGKVADVAEKQDYANQGIALLCQFVLQGLEGYHKPEILQGFHAYSRLERSASKPFLTTSGLKELQNFSEGLLMGAGSRPGDARSNIGSPNLQRSLTTNALSFIPSSVKGMVELNQRNLKLPRDAL